LVLGWRGAGEVGDGRGSVSEGWGGSDPPCIRRRQNERKGEERASDSPHNITIPLQSDPLPPPPPSSSLLSVIWR